MEHAAKSTNWTSEQWARLGAYAKGFEGAWDKAGLVATSVDLSPHLPASGDPLRRAVLLELIKIDLEIRWRRDHHPQIEQYVQRFPELGPAAAVPASLIYEEYRIRHCYGDRPELASYQQRFAAQYAELCQLVQDQPPPTIMTKDQTPSVAVRDVPVSGHLASGQTLPGGGYKLIKPIGRGAFGEVWRAEAPGGVEVAIKIILRPLDHEEAQRELQSLELIKRLRHPYLLQTQAYWSLQNHLQIVMELADGSLRGRLEECRQHGKKGIPVQELMVYFPHAAEALDFLHDNGVQHRDIKPDNILLLQRFAKLADFGLAHFLAVMKSTTANACGTAPYMGPEVWQNKLSPHSDQYSLAVTYAELRLGRRPFAGDNMFALSREHLVGTPDLESLPDAEKQILLKALAKNPRERYPSCREFVEELRKAVARELRRTNPEFKLSSDSGGFEVEDDERRKSEVGTSKPTWRNPSETMLRRRTFLRGAIWASATLLGGAVLVVWLSNRKEVDWLPPDCTKADGAEVVVVNAQRLWNRIEKKIKNGPSVPFRLIPQQDDSLRTFYMMETKVSNDLFEAAQHDPEFQESLEKYRKDPPGLVKDQWQKDRSDVLAANPGMDWGRLPVLNVTVTEAYLFAKWLDKQYGQLPSVDEWEKAAGVQFKEKLEGPFQPGWKPGQIAVGRAFPLPVGTAECDISPEPYLCRDMAGNGYEWTRNCPGGYSVPVTNPNASSLPLVQLRGQSYEEAEPYKFIGWNIISQPYKDASPNLGFRVVLEALPLSAPTR